MTRTTFHGELDPRVENERYNETPPYLKENKMFTQLKPGQLLIAMLATAAICVAANEVHQFITRDLKEPIKLARKKLATQLSNVIYPDQKWD